MIPFQHLLQQGPVLATLGSAALEGAWRSVVGGKAAGLSVPGPEIVATLAPRSPALVSDYLTAVGGDPGAYGATVPPHLFPQWGFPLVAKTLAGLDQPLVRVLNAGCRIEMRRPLPAGEPLEVRARLEEATDDDRRLFLRQSLVTGTKSAPEAIVAELRAIVPKRAATKSKSEPVRVPDRATELESWRIPADAGLEFAVLTGDFNPVHWVGPWARAFGFGGVILHGFATLARAYEGLVRTRFSGRPDVMASIDVRFTRPLVLPAEVGLFADGNEVFVGAAPGAEAVLVGRFETRETSGG